jgi:hypothetical protein
MALSVAALSFAAHLEGRWSGISLLTAIASAVDWRQTYLLEPVFMRELLVGGCAGALLIGPWLIGPWLTALDV